MNNYSVWVGSIEVNDCYLTLKQAEYLKKLYSDYNDVIIRKEVV